MRTYRLARVVAFLLFLAALVDLLGGLILGIVLWSNGLGAGWGSGFAGWLSIPIFVGAFFGALTLLMFGVVLYFLTAINANLAAARQSGILATPKPEARPTPAVAPPVVPPAPRPTPPEPIVVAPTEPVAVSPDLLAELPAADADADAAPPQFTGRLPGADQAARIASELASAPDAAEPTA
jgi:hypothetical protein